MAKAIKASELRAKTTDERDTMLLDLKREQFNLRFQRAVGQTEATSRVREVRRGIARIKTVQHAHNKAHNKTAAAAAASK